MDEADTKRLEIALMTNPWTSQSRMIQRLKQSCGS